MDKYRLEYEMKRKRISVTKLCSEINMSKSAYYRKCNGTSEFTQSEIQQIVNLLGLSSPMGIFFEENVSYRTQEAKEVLNEQACIAKR